MPLVLLPILLLAIPISEIATFIVVGRAIGVLPTLGLVVASAAIGAVLLKRQGLGALRRIQAETRAGRVPGRELVDGAMIVAAGVLLVTPGLLTDVFGYLLFVPWIRERIWRFLRSRVRVTGTPTPGGRTWTTGRVPAPGARPNVVDLAADDYERRDDDPSSPWTGTQGGNRTLH